jgi:hypothetical protein
MLRGIPLEPWRASKAAFVSKLLMMRLFSFLARVIPDKENAEKGGIMGKKIVMTIGFPTLSTMQK